MAFFVSFPNLCLAITRPVYNKILWNYHHSLAKHVFLLILSAGTRISDIETHLVPNLIWAPRNLGSKNLVTKKFGPREIWSPRNLGPHEFHYTYVIFMQGPYFFWPIFFWSHIIKHRTYVNKVFWKAWMSY